MEVGKTILRNSTKWKLEKTFYEIQLNGSYEIQLNGSWKKHFKKFS
jgi:hypothetical protein